MNVEALLKFIALVQQVSAALPSVVSAIKGSLSSEDEAELKAALLEQQAKNHDDYKAAIDLLSGIAAKKD